jgi:hypothetical protein
MSNKGFMDIVGNVRNVEYWVDRLRCGFKVTIMGKRDVWECGFDLNSLSDLILIGMLI